MFLKNRCRLAGWSLFPAAHTLVMKNWIHGEKMPEPGEQQDLYWMRLALDQAREAMEKGEVPVGAVLVSPGGELLAQASNAPILLSDPTAHAEILALRSGASLTGNYRLGGCMLYVTLEPCAMCVGAIQHARLARVVYAAKDPKTGVVHSQIRLPDTGPFNHHLEWVGGVLAEESARLLRQFFRARRSGAGLQDAGRGCRTKWSR